MTQSIIRQNLPNAKKLIYSLRHLDYDNITAITDIVDNSIDADATEIRVNFVAKEKVRGESELEKIIVSDNGSGMDEHVLDEALKLGSDTEKNPSYDLGLYGMGLVTASISIGTKLTVLTKTESGKLLKSIQDLELVYEKNDFVKILSEADTDDEELFRKYNKDCISGTVVIIEEIDNPTYNTIKGLSTNLGSHFAQTYRKFLKAAKNTIFIQDTEIHAIDPIYDFEPNILIEDEVILDEGKIKIVIAELKDYGAQINKDKGLNIKNQGFYVIRNNREILSGVNFDLFPKHNDFNLMRIEFSYPGTLDNVLASTFSKNRITLNQSVKDKVSQLCLPYIKQIRNRAKSRQRPNVSPEESFSDVEKYITQKSHLLKQPKNIEQEDPNNIDRVSEPKIRPETERLSINKRPRVNLDNLKVKFLQKNLGEKGPLYEPDKDKSMVIVYWNVEHPFYKHFIEVNQGKPDVLNPVYFLVYSLANAELISKIGSDSEEILDNIRWDVGRNLAVLLND